MRQPYIKSTTVLSDIINPRRACVCVSVRNLNLGTGANRGLNEGISE